MSEKPARLQPTPLEWLRMAAPTLAVAVGMGLFRSGLLAMALYHLQVLLWRPGIAARSLASKPGATWVAVAAGFGLAGPVLYLLGPLLLPPGALAGWLDRYGLGASALRWLVPYFGLVHPILEELHWRPLRRHGLRCHASFAAYHLFVLAGLLPPVLLVAIGAALAAASWLWGRMEVQCGSSRLPILAHALADLGIVLAAARLAGAL